jgi:hypothetical protein
MTPYEAQEKATRAMDALKSLRDEFGDELANCQTSSKPSKELRQMSDLHDRLARAITAYHRSA